MNLQELLKFAMDSRASDLHLSAGMVPMLRIDGAISPLYEEKVLEHDTLIAALDKIMTDRHREILAHNLSVDLSYNLDKNSRFRVNIYMQRLGIAAAFRGIPYRMPSLEGINAPKILNQLILRERGLILVTGPTGSGKSTTLAAMLSEINKNHKKHIITIEDPIEFVHESYNCLINQREIGQDALDFNSSLAAALREDPDIILVGEIRDLETIRLALTAAETGHLVFATLHTSSAAKTIDRIVDVFPGDEKSMVRTMLSESLCAIVAQTLIPKASGSGRIAGFEILVATPAVRNLIRENKISQLYSVLQTGAQYGMQTLDSHLQHLVLNGLISQDSLARCSRMHDGF
ncbi:MAG: type IV pilus twitching motility protein PilT [Gammaproteobacteria bacterium]|nr:type IV pilus twitching motility protein PilT [Gammaproteobacteria bacterium]